MTHILWQIGKILLGIFALVIIIRVLSPFFTTWKKFYPYDVVTDEHLAQYMSQWAASNNVAKDSVENVKKVFTEQYQVIKDSFLASTKKILHVKSVEKTIAKAARLYTKSK